MSEHEAAGAQESTLPPRSVVVTLVLGGIILPGVVSYLLDGAGYTLASDIAWVGGYALGVFLAWYGWIRPLDITGPD